MKKKKEIEKYKGYAFKLNLKTIKLLRKIKNESGLSWNLFFYKVIVEWVNIPHNKMNYRKIFYNDYRKFRKDYCEECDAKEKFKRVGHYNRSNLLVHHIDKDITNNKEENLKTLCVNCHNS